MKKLRLVLYFKLIIAKGGENLFEGIIGNDKIKQELLKSVILNKFSHSYLFVGTSGIGKKLIAREFSKMILCEASEKYCNICKSCKEFDSGNNPDFQEIFPDGSNVKIDQIRQMQAKVFESPIISKRKVYIIDDADLMTKEAQNCLLKTLEEPPEFVTIILVGSNESNFLSTIKSRCITIKFDDISQKDTDTFLKENYPQESISENIIKAANGSIGKAIYLKDKQELYASIDKIFNNIEVLDLIDTLNIADIIYKSTEDKFDILEYINIILFQKAKENLKYINTINIVEDTKNRLKANSNYNMTIDNLIMTIWEELH